MLLLVWVCPLKKMSVSSWKLNLANDVKLWSQRGLRGVELKFLAIVSLFTAASFIVAMASKHYIFYFSCPWGHPVVH